LPLSSFLMIVICILTDVAPSLALIWEQQEGDLMKRQPNIKTGTRLFGFGTAFHTFAFLGNLETFGAMFMYFFYMWNEGRIKPLHLTRLFDYWSDGFYGYTQLQLDELLFGAQTCYFVAIVMIQFGNLLTTRTLRLSMFEQLPLFRAKTKNNVLFLGMGISAFIASSVVYLPVFHTVFNTRPIKYYYWFMPMAFGFLMFAANEIRKLILRCCGCIKTGIVNKISSARSYRKRYATVAQRPTNE